MTIELLVPLMIRVNGQDRDCLVGDTLSLPEAQALRLLRKAPGLVRRVDSTITWTRGDGTTQTGLVDFVHVDLDGIAWAFVTIGETWATINMKFVKEPQTRGRLC